MTAYYRSPIGILKIEAGDNFVTSIVFHEEDIQDVHYPVNRVITQCMQELDSYFAGDGRNFSFPKQQAGTAFQSKVWSALETIPYGKTTSYLSLSKQLGDVKAIRAVGTANGRNNLAIVVPCHRVIGSNASLTGYAGGLWRKQWLLEHEAKHAAGLQLLF